MNKTNYTARPYIMKSGQIMIRVRWDKKKQEVGFCVGYSIDPAKWDNKKQLVKNNTTHKIKGKTIYATEINKMIRDYLAYIEEAFTECDLHSGFMTKEHLKEYVNSKTRINKLEVLIQDDEKMSLTEIFNEFILEFGIMK